MLLPPESPSGTGANLPQIILEEFEGPFDLLIELARADKFDLTAVSLSKITDSFLQYLQQQPLSAAAQADFLVVASTLLLLKIRQLLPDGTAEEDVEISELTDRLRIYQYYRTQALRLRAQWDTRPLLAAPERLTLTASQVFPTLTAGGLADALHTVLARRKPPLKPARHLRQRARTLQECVTLFSQRLRLAKQVVFQHELRGESRPTLAVSFLAVLELARQQKVRLSQAQPFDELLVEGLVQ